MWIEIKEGCELPNLYKSIVVKDNHYPTDLVVCFLNAEYEWKLDTTCLHSETEIELCITPTHWLKLNLDAV